MTEQNLPHTTAANRAELMEERITRLLNSWAEVLDAKALPEKDDLL